INHVAVPQQQVLRHVSAFEQRLDVERARDAVADDLHALKRGLRCRTASDRERFDQRERNVGDGDYAGGRDFAGHVNSLASECSDTNVELRILDEAGEPLRDLVANIGKRASPDLNDTDIREKDRAVRADEVPLQLRGAIFSGRDRELRVIPDREGQNVLRTYRVTVGAKLLRQLGIRARPYNIRNGELCDDGRRQRDELEILCRGLFGDTLENAGPRWRADVIPPLVEPLAGQGATAENRRRDGRKERMGPPHHRPLQSSTPLPS